MKLLSSSLCEFRCVTFLASIGDSARGTANRGNSCVPRCSQSLWGFYFVSVTDSLIGHTENVRPKGPPESQYGSFWGAQLPPRVRLSAKTKGQTSFWARLYFFIAQQHPSFLHGPFLLKNTPFCFTTDR